MTTPSTFALTAIGGYSGATRLRSAGAVIAPPTRTGARGTGSGAAGGGGGVIVDGRNPPMTPPGIPPGTPPSTPPRTPSSPGISVSAVSARISTGGSIGTGRALLVTTGFAFGRVAVVAAGAGGGGGGDGGGAVATNANTCGT